MRRLVITAVVAVFLTVPTVASAQGYPTVAQANAFTAKGTFTASAAPESGSATGRAPTTSTAPPPAARTHATAGSSSGTQHIYIPFERSQGCYSHDWVRLESNYTLTWHVDDGPHCS
jgi:hypothetical protein